VNLSSLDRALRALGPYVEDVVLCGAWVWYVHRRCSGAATWLPKEFTRDVDCVGRDTLALRGGALLQACLEAQEFVWAPRGDEIPPVALFAWPSIASPEVEIEFLAPARRDGSVRVVELQKGVTAQTLRDVDILLDEPVRVRMDDGSPLAMELPYRGTFQIPKVGHFCIQKALIHRRRSVEQQIKDVFYGMSAAVLSDVVAAEGRWRAGVSALVELLHQRAREPRFLKALAEQFPTERRPLLPYVEHEIETWLGQLAIERAKRT